MRSFFFLLSLFFPAVEKKKHEQQQKAANASINNQTHKEYSEQAWHTTLAQKMINREVYCTVLD